MKSQCLTGFACLAVLVASSLQAAPAKRTRDVSRPAAPQSAVPDFWYVVPDDSPATASSTEMVRGIVIPTSVTPTVRTTPSGSVVSWTRPNGTKQSFVVQGVSSFTFEPGPLKGTTYVPFVEARRMTWDPTGCCLCASWRDHVESAEQLACVPGCVGCGCEGCICSPSYPCPGSPFDPVVLRPNKGTSPSLTVETTGGTRNVSAKSHGIDAVSFRGEHLEAFVGPDGTTGITNPDAILVRGRVATHTSVRGDQTFFGWSSPEASVMVAQPTAMPAPSFQGGTIDLSAPSMGAELDTAKRLAIEPVTDQCKVCGFHPNSDADFNIWECVAGNTNCTRCIIFPCLASPQ